MISAHEHARQNHDGTLGLLTVFTARHLLGDFSTQMYEIYGKMPSPIWVSLIWRPPSWRLWISPTYSSL